MHKQILLICTLLLALASCESDELTQQGNTPATERKLLLNPPHLDGEQYAQYTLRARVTNVASGDLYFIWDLDEGAGFSDTGAVIKPVFYQNRVHAVQVRAIDNFADTLIAADTMRVDIRPPTASVDVKPDAIDTATLTTSGGGVSVHVSFTMKSPIPERFTIATWNFGDGTGEGTTYGTVYAGHIYTSPGIYKAIATVRDTAGAVLGSDTSIVNIRITPPTMDLMTTAHTIAVYLLLDSTHPVAQNPLFKNPFAAAFPTTDLSTDTLVTTTSSFGERDFTLGYLYKSPIQSHRRKLKQDTISCMFNEDLSLLESLTLSVNDSGVLLYPSSLDDGKLKYTLVLKNVRLAVNTISYISYEATELEGVLGAIEFHPEVLTNHPTGSLVPGNAVTIKQGVRARLEIKR